MNELRVTLDLGSVEIDLEDVVAMRPGARYSFERPACFDATLRIEGKPWASARLEVCDDVVSLQIQAIGPQINSVSILKK